MYLVYGNTNQLNRSSSARFDVYSISLNSVEFHSTRQIPVGFSFLPLNRLALIVDLTERLQSKTDEPIPDDVCPLGRYGSRCSFVDHSCSENNETCLNGGTCYPFDLRLDKFKLICLCPSLYFGRRCEHQSASIELQVSRTVQRQLAPSIDLNEIALLVVYFVDIFSSTPQLDIRAHLIYSNVSFEHPLLITYHREVALSDLLIAQVFYHADESDYFLVGLHRHSIFFERTIVLASHQCWHINELAQLVDLQSEHRLEIYRSD